MNAKLTQLVLVWFILTPFVYADRYVGKYSSEANLKFSYQVTFRSNATPTEDNARRKIDEQVAHLFGSMGSSNLPGVPARDHKISNIKIKPATNGHYTASYFYDGNVVLHNSAGDRYYVALPINPDDIYEASVISGKSRCITDSEEDFESAFWYFWSPFRPGCPLRENVHFQRVAATVKRKPNTSVSYPEYARMPIEGIIPIHIFFGLQDGSHNANPLQSTDINADQYRRVRNALMQLGYQGKSWTTAEIQAISHDARLPFVEEFSRQFPRAKVVVRMFFGHTSLWETSQAFHFFLKDAIENASAMIYDGHSGFGANLHLGRIETKENFKFAVPTDRYQIYYFNSCSSYPYYRTEFFTRKKNG